MDLRGASQQKRESLFVTWVSRSTKVVGEVTVCNKGWSRAASAAARSGVDVRSVAAEREMDDEAKVWLAGDRYVVPG